MTAQQAWMARNPVPQCRDTGSESAGNFPCDPARTPGKPGEPNQQRDLAKGP